MKTVVWISTRFQGCHRWKDAPDSTAFLRDWHRHLFHVKVGVVVSHGNREVEFFHLKREVDIFLQATYEGRQFEASCEMIAGTIGRHFNAHFVEVSEDGENGAYVEFETQASARVKTRCFIGTEAEGPHRGCKVLFVPGCVTPIEYKAAMARLESQSLSVERVYYGAGNSREFKIETMNEIRRLFKDNQIDVEVKSLKALGGHPLPKAVTVISLDYRDQDADYTKTVTETMITWVGKGQVYTTGVADVLFDQDRYI